MSWSPPAPGGGGSGISTLNSAVPTLAITNPSGPTTTADLESGIVTPGSFGTRFVTPRVTVDTYGRVTALTNNAQILLSSMAFTMDLLTGVSGAVSLAVGNLYVVSTMSGAATATLPTAIAAGAGNYLILARSDISANVLTLAPNGSDTIAGSTDTQNVVPGASMWIVSDGISNWTLL